MQGLKGLWIPLEVLKDNNLSDKERIIYSLILFFSRNNELCYMSNDYLKNLLNISIVQVSKLVNSLKDKGYIEIELVREEQTKRIKSRVLKPLKQKENLYLTKLNEDIKEKFKDNKNIYKNNYKKVPLQCNYEQRKYTAEELEHLYANY